MGRGINHDSMIFDCNTFNNFLRTRKLSMRKFSNITGIHLRQLCRFKENGRITGKMANKIQKVGFDIHDVFFPDGLLPITMYEVYIKSNFKKIYIEEITKPKNEWPKIKNILIPISNKNEEYFGAFEGNNIEKVMADVICSIHKMEVK